MSTSVSMATCLASAPSHFLNLPLDIRQVVYEEVFSHKTFDVFRNNYFALAETSRRLRDETFEFAMRKFYSFSHSFFFGFVPGSNEPFRFEWMFPGKNFEPITRNLVDPKILRRFSNVSILFDSSWTNELLHTTPAFRSAIDLLMWMFGNRSTPMSLSIWLPVTTPRVRFGRIVLDLEPLALLPAICNVNLVGNWIWEERMLEEWKAKRWSFVLTGRRQRTPEEVLDGLLDVIEKRVHSAAEARDAN